MRILHAGHDFPGASVFTGKPDPTNDEIRWGISGNLCRCTGYQNIVKAIRNAADRINAGREAAE